MTWYDKMVARLNGERPQIYCWSPTEYRVAYHGWHVHNGACTGHPVGDGKTLELACQALLRYIDRPSSELVHGDCDQPCHNRYTGSDKAKIAHRELMAHITKVASEVDRWPAWKRGLPSCPTETCSLALGHKCPCET